MSDEQAVGQECGEDIDPMLTLRAAMLSTAVNGATQLDVALLLTDELGALIASSPTADGRRKFRKMVNEMLDEAIEHGVVARWDA